MEPSELPAKMPDKREPTLHSDLGDSTFGLTAERACLGHPALEDPIAKGPPGTAAYRPEQIEPLLSVILVCHDRAQVTFPGVTHDARSAQR